MLISNIAFMLSLILLYRLTGDLANNRVARRTIFYLAAFPSSFFFSVAYSESLFLLFTLITILLARSRHWRLSALVAGLATATRLPGILLLIIIGLEWAKMQGWTLSTARQSQAWCNLAGSIRQNWREIIVIAMVPMGLIAYMLYLQIVFGSPFAWLQATSTWGRAMTDPLTTIINDIGRVLRGETLGGHTLVFIDGLNVVLVFLILLMLPSISRRVGGIYALYCLMSVLLPLFNRSESMNRYILMMFPAFIVFAHWGQRKWIDIALKIFFLPFLAIFSALFTNWIFVG